MNPSIHSISWNSLSAVWIVAVDESKKAVVESLVSTEEGKTSMVKENTALEAVSPNEAAKISLSAAASEDKASLLYIT